MTDRRPLEQKPARMAPLARLPVFFALEGKRAIVSGEGDAVAWKAELLAAAGARVEVYATEPGEALQALAVDPPNGSITIYRRPVTAEDFTGAAIAIGGAADDAAAADFAAMARAAGVPVNVIDKPAYCDFSFGAIVNRSPLVVGISTDGGAPVFAQAIRARIESMIPIGFARWAEAARRWRPRVKALGLNNRSFWQNFVERAVTAPEHAPEQAEFDALVAGIRSVSAPSGAVTLVGAGPGDPELLTLRAVRALQSADVILIDDLVAPEILDFARREAKKMMVGKTGHGPACKQSEINDLMIKLARAGKRVVRLKGGDPLVFGRAGEEIEACRAAGIAVEVVPGISAAQGAAAKLGMSLTHRSVARRVQFVTGHDQAGKLPDLDWSALADSEATTVVYMPKRTLAEFAREALARGLDPATPAVAVANATRPGEAAIRGTIANLPARIAAADLAGPVLVIIGQAVALAKDHHPAAPEHAPETVANTDVRER